MLNLMKLELKRNKTSSYMHAAIIALPVVIGFTYLMAYAPQENPSDSSLSLFENYNNIVIMSIFISMAYFVILSAVLYARFVIEEYTGKRSTLIFSYPVNRKRVLLAKFAVVSMFTFIAMVTCSFLSLGIFSATEMIAPMVNDKLTTGVLLGAVKDIIIMAVIAVSLGILATGIGFIKKSVPTTIVSAVLIVSVLSNLMSGALTNDMFLLIVMLITTAVALLTVGILAKKVNHMEVE
jgi:hypothetical protein